MFQSTHPRDQNAERIQVNLGNSQVRWLARTIRLVGGLPDGSNLPERIDIYCHAVHTTHALGIGSSLAQEPTERRIYLWEDFKEDFVRNFISTYKRHASFEEL